MTDLLIGFSLGLSTGLVAFRWGLRSYIQNKLALRKLISEMYHRDLLPEICRMEGLIDLGSKEQGARSKEFTELALREIRKHKEKVIALIKKYEKLQ